MTLQLRSLLASAARRRRRGGRAHFHRLPHGHRAPAIGARSRHHRRPARSLRPARSREPDSWPNSRCADSRAATTSRSTRRRRSPASRPRCAIFFTRRSSATPRLPNQSASGSVRRKTATRAADVLAYAQQHYAAGVGPNGRERSHRRRAARHHELGARSLHRLSLAARDSRAQRVAVGRELRRHRRLHLSAQRRPHRRAADRAMPAARAGMKPGEVVDSVDGKPVRGLPLDRVEAMIRGEAGTIVRLTRASV